MTPPPARPTITVVGLGPAGPELLSPAARELLAGPGPCVLRTHRHPAAAPYAALPSMDHWYRSERSFEDVYRGITEELVAMAEELAASGGGPAHGVVYAVPGSPLVAEETVARLRAEARAAAGAEGGTAVRAEGQVAVGRPEGRVAVTVHPALSFLDLAWARLGVDPVDAGVTLVDGTRFAESVAGLPGPFLVAQCWSTEVLSAVKLAPDADEPPATATLLHHLGLDDERVEEVPWADLDRAVAPDHLTSLWVPRLAAPVAQELVALDELVRTLRARCPWDREQTHASLARHLLEESYEVLDALAALEASATPEAVDHLEEELGDLLFQVFFHARLAAEEGRFTVADVAAGVHAKLVARHPHVFGDVVVDSAADVAAGWEVAKLAEKGRASVTDGIPATLPSLSLASELLRKAPAGGVAPRPADEVRAEARSLLDRFAAGADHGGTAGAGGRGAVPSTGDAGDGAGSEGAGASGSGAAARQGCPGDADQSDPAGALLLDVAELVRGSGVDPELALRAAAAGLRRRIVATEGAPESTAAEGAPESTAAEPVGEGAADP